MIFEIIFIIVLLLFLLAAGIIAVLIIFREKKYKENLPIVFNFMSHKNNKRCLGVLLNTIPGKGGREILEYSAKDLDESSKPENHKVIVESNKKIVLPKGELSSERDIIFLLPHSPDDFPEKLKNTEFGRLLGLFTELENVKRHVIDILKEGQIRREDLMKEIAGGEISRRYIKMTQEMLQDAIETITKGREGKVGKEEQIGSPR